jgi:hypothetical protein
MRSLMGLAALAFAASAPISVAAADRPAAGPPPNEVAEGSIPQSVWRRDADDAYESLQTGLRCPTSQPGGLARDGTVTTFDAFGLDIACGYNAPADGVVLSLYLTRLPDVDAAFADAKKQLIDHFGAGHAKLLSDGPAKMGGLDWREAAYEITDGGRSDVWMAYVGGWMIEYRASYPAAKADAARHGLETLTGLVQATAIPRLQICAKGPAPARRGKPVTDKKYAEVGLLGSLLSQAAAMDSKDSKQLKPATPIIFCPEQPISQDGKPLMLWRGHNLDGEDAEVDRISAMTIESPLDLDIAVDGLGNLIATEASGHKVQRWTASLSDGKSTRIFAYYNGRPPASLTAPLLLDILSGKARSLGGISADGKTISISTP